MDNLNKMPRHKLHITYCHGSENYFLAVDALNHHIGFKEVDFQQFTINTITQLTDIKIDGILYLLPSEKADARMRIFNRDGSEAEMCGNGFRCLGKKLWQITGKTTYQIETLSGILKGEKKSDMFPDIDTFSVLFPKVRLGYKGKVFDNQLIPELSTKLRFSSIDIGNPHLISQVADFDLDKLNSIGKKVNQNCSLFPQGNNISFYKITEKNQLFVITYERGVGLTASCGTAMAATAVLAARNKQVDVGQIIKVYSPGGMIQCIVNKTDNYQVELSGNATFEKQFQLIYDSDSGKIVDIQQTGNFTKQIENYKTFKTHIKYIHI